MCPKLVVHPFLGFMHRPRLPISRLADDDRIHRLLVGADLAPPWTSMRANNHWVFSPHDYPYVKSDRDEFIIGIFGGSVAH